MDKARRYTLRIGGGILGLLLLLWIAAYTIIALKKESISAMAIEQVNKQIHGVVTIGDLQPDIFRAFPNISVRISDITVRDSLWDVHQHDFLTAEEVYIRIQLLSLLTGKPKIGKVSVDNSNIYLYTDECGYCNLSRKDNVSFNKGNGEIPALVFRNTRLVVENEFLNSYHDIEAYHMKVDANSKENETILNIDMDALVHSIGFNMAKGSYLKEKTLEGNFRVVVESGKMIRLDDLAVDIDDHPFVINGMFNTANVPMTYDLHFETQNIDFRKAVGVLTQSLQSKFDSMEIAKPINAKADISGAMAFRVVPRVYTEFSVADSEMRTPVGRLGATSFTGSFFNQADSLQPPGDPNSQFIFNDVTSSLANIPFTSTKFEVNNLLHPFIKGDVQSFIELPALNDLTESSTIHFTKGTGNLDITYEGPFTEHDTTKPSLNGSLTLVDAEFNYLPRNLLFQNGIGVLEFRNEDLIIKNLMVSAGTSNLTMSGTVLNLLALINVNPEKLVMEWNVSTPEIDLNDFLTYVKPVATSTVKKSTAKNRLVKLTDKVDQMLQDGTAKLTIKAEKVSYKKFKGTDLAASVMLVGNDVFFNNVRVQHSRGSSLLNGSLRSGKNASQLSLVSSIEKVHIPDLFYAFDNFGQDAITHQNMKGNLTASIRMDGALTHQGQVLQNSMNGDVDFNLTDGELNNFEPIMNVGKKALKNRDFSNIKFGDLTSHLDVKGSAITLDRMEIRSNVAVLFVEGLYDTKKGTDMSIQVPVSNLSKEENDDLENTGRAGVNVRLRAKTGSDGKLNVTFDPFNKASKERNAAVDGNTGD